MIARLLGEWLPEAGLDLAVVRAHAGEALPADLDGYAALVVLGGGQHAYRRPDDTGIRDFCPKPVCTKCGMIGEDVRPDWSAHDAR